MCPNVVVEVVSIMHRTVDTQTSEIINYLVDRDTERETNLVNDTLMNFIRKSTDYRVVALASSIIGIHNEFFHFKYYCNLKSILRSKKIIKCLFQEVI